MRTFLRRRVSIFSHIEFHINDKNIALIQFYCDIKNNPARLIEDIKSLSPMNNNIDYYKIRDEFNTLKLTEVGRTINLGA